MRANLILTLGAMMLALAACGGGGSSSGGGTANPANPGGGGTNTNPVINVSGMSGSGGAYTLNVQTGNALPATITVTGSDLNSGDNLSLSVVFNAALSTNYSAIPAQLVLSPTPGGSPATSVATATAPGTANVTIAPNGALTQAGVLVFNVILNDGYGAANATLTINVSAAPANNPPALGNPTGPGTLGGSDPSFSASIAVGASLAFSVTATDPDASNSLTLSAAVSGGTLSASQAGFTTSFPATVTGVSPRTLNVTGTAAMAGSITLSFSVTDGAGGVDGFTLAITITGGTTTPPGTNPTNGSGGAYPGNQSRTINVSGLGSQTYYLYIPSNYNPSTPLPVLFAFHGSGGAGTAPAAAQSVRTSWSSVANTEDFIVIAPAATGSSGGWLAGNDTTILNDIINDSFSAYNIDQNRVYGWGFSAGGHYLHAIALSSSTFFAAYSVSAGVLDVLAGASAPASATRKIPVDIHIGTSDSLLPYAQTDRTRFINAGWTLNTNLYYTEFSGGHTYTTGHLSTIWNNISSHALP